MAPTTTGSASVDLGWSTEVSETMSQSHSPLKCFTKACGHRKLSDQGLMELGHWDGHFQVFLGKFLPCKLEDSSVTPEPLHGRVGLGLESQNRGDLNLGIFG